MGNKYLIKPNHKGYKTLEFNCEFCNSIFWESKHSASRKKRHFCSMECYINFRKFYLPKEEQPRFGKGFDKNERQKRAKARSDLNHAIRNDKIKREICGICGKRAEAHHDNYDKPLDVKWFCNKHHWKYHKENPELLKEAKMEITQKIMITHKCPKCGHGWEDEEEVTIDYEPELHDEW